MLSIILWAILFLVIAAVGLVMWKNSFVMTVGVVGFAILLIVSSFKNYGNLTTEQFWAVELKRFTCLYACACFTVSDVFNLKDDFGNPFILVIQPAGALANFGVSAVSAAGLLVLTDFFLPFWLYEGALTTFKYGGYLGIFFLVPGGLLLLLWIFKFYKFMRGR